LVELASFQVFVPHQSPPSLLDNSYNIFIAIVIIAAIGGCHLLGYKKEMRYTQMSNVYTPEVFELVFFFHLQF
jgi:hypothetical protein